MTKETKQVTGHGIKRVNIKDLNKYIDNTIAHAKQGDGKLHNAGYACLERAMTNGDIRPAKRLVEGLGRRSIRVNALIAYFVAVGPFSYNEETKELELNQEMKLTGNSYAGDLEKGWSKPFWEYSAIEGKTITFDLDKLLENLAKKVAKRMQEPKEGDKIPASKVKLLEELYPEVFAAKEKETIEKVEVTKVKATRKKAA